MTLLGDGGTLVSFGSMTGEPMQLSSGDVIFKQATVKGFWGSKVSQAMASDDKRRLVGELLQLAARGGLSLPVDGVFGLDEVAAAFNRHNQIQVRLTDDAARAARLSGSLEAHRVAALQAFLQRDARFVIRREQDTVWVSSR